MVGDTFQLCDGRTQAEGVTDRHFGRGNFLFGREQNFISESVDSVIKSQDLAGQVFIEVGKGTHGVSGHPNHTVGHHAKCGIRGTIKIISMVQHNLGNIHATVGDPFQLVVEFDHRQDGANACVVGLSHGQKWHRGTFNFNVNPVDLIVRQHRGIGFVLIEVEPSLYGREQEALNPLTLADKVRSNRSVGIFKGHDVNLSAQLVAER